MSDTNPFLKMLISALEDIQAQEIKVMHVSQQTTVTDYMIICSGRSSRHVKAIAQTIMEQMKAAGLTALGSSGLENSDWALVDFGDFVVHILQPESRTFYNLEELWQD